MGFVEKEKHIEGLIDKLTVRLEQAANLAGGSAAVKKEEGAAMTQSAEDGAQADGDDDSAPLTRATETVSCLSNALGAMNYTDRCILRLHDAIVVQKRINIALSYHSVARKCILNIVDKARKKPGKRCSRRSN